MLRKIFLVTTVILLIIAGCSTRRHSSESLANQGILPLSTDNPYLGTNLYIAGQAELSNILFKFLQGKGGPTAMELIQNRFSPPRMLLYYPKNREVYAADLEERDGVNEWIVRGPLAIQRKDHNTLMRMQVSLIGEPLFVIFGTEYRFGRSVAADTGHAVLRPTIPLPLPTPTPVKKRIIITQPKNPTPTTDSEEPSLTDFKKLNSDQQAILMSKGYVERADNGDAIHTVRSASENIANIGKWYTGANSNTVELENINNITAGTQLTVNQRIRIPLKLLKNLKVMPVDYK